MVNNIYFPEYRAIFSIQCIRLQQSMFELIKIDTV